MTCKQCGQPIKYARSVQTKRGPVVFCNKPKCRKAADELLKYVEQTAKKVAA